MIDAAIVGLGRWGRSFVESVQGKSGRIRFVRGVETNPDPARAFAQQHGFELSTSLEEALADRTVQAVVLATPHSLHRGQVIAAAKAGKQVFCEKPLALTAQQQRKLQPGAGRLEAFADAVDGRAPFPVTPAQMLATVEAFEATVRALETGLAVEVEAGSMRCTHGT